MATHTRNRRDSRCALLLLLGLTSFSACAFGPDGHRIIADLAQRSLSPTATAQVATLLAGEPHTTLADIANWADEVRKTAGHANTAPLHYVNFPRSSCRYDAMRDCPHGQCVVEAITRHAATLADPGQPFEARRDALKFVVHFVGDIHQPLHAGYADDKGGNLFQVYYVGRGSNLHALWDGCILRAAKRDWRDYTDLLAPELQDDDAHWSPTAPRQWAEASCRLIGATRLYPERPGRLDAGYVERQRPVVERQLVIAAARLASLLNATLTAND